MRAPLVGLSVTREPANVAWSVARRPYTVRGAWLGWDGRLTFSVRPWGLAISRTVEPRKISRPGLRELHGTLPAPDPTPAAATATHARRARQGQQDTLLAPMSEDGGPQVGGDAAAEPQEPASPREEHMREGQQSISADGEEQAGGGNSEDGGAQAGPRGKGGRGQREPLLVAGREVVGRQIAVWSQKLLEWPKATVAQFNAGGSAAHTCLLL